MTRKVDVWDRTEFHPDMTVKELREVAAHYGVTIRPKASRDEVAAIFREHSLTALPPASVMLQVWRHHPDAVFRETPESDYWEIDAMHYSA
jgi:hypothetical protein